MNMKSMIVVALAFSARLVFAGSPVVSDVVARQRYPWNGMVDIDYTLSGDTSGLGVLITMKDMATGTTYTPTKFCEVIPTGAGTHRVTWSTEAEGLTSLVTSQMVANVALMRITDTPTVTNDLYLVMDLSGGPTAISYPISYLDAVPNGGVWPDEYKTTKLVMRKIPAGTYTMAEGETYQERQVTISRSFYVGVFEVTQRQWELVMGSNPSWYKGDMRPVGNVSYNMIRGSSAGASWPESSAVDSTSFLGKLRARTALDSFDLPTDGQWEYACRAGATSGLYNNGGSTDADLKTLGRYSGNQDDGRGGYSGPGATTVGSYAPNAWGLYDMHGNAIEWCLDWCDNDYWWRNTPLVDPKGPAPSALGRVVRGGSWDDVAIACRSSCRGPRGQSMALDYSGFRLFCSAGL